MSKKTLHPALAIIGALCGIAIMAGSLAAWHYLGMDGFVAFLISGGGFALLSKCVTGSEMVF